MAREGQPLTYDLLAALRPSPNRLHTLVPVSNLFDHFLHGSLIQLTKMVAVITRNAHIALDFVTNERLSAD
jgi:hypothetical protein